MAQSTHKSFKLTPDRIMALRGYCSGGANHSMERKPLRGCASLAPLVGQNDDPIDLDRRTADLNAFKLHSQFTNKWLSSFYPSRGFRSSRARSVSGYTMKSSNILKIQSLKNIWTDKDVIMLHACFQLLKDCVEQEHLLDGHIDWNHTKEFQEIKKKIEELYTWWNQRLEIQCNDGFNDLDDSQYEEDNKKLIELINIRKYLWT